MCIRDRLIPDGIATCSDIFPVRYNMYRFPSSVLQLSPHFSFRNHGVKFLCFLPHLSLIHIYLPQQTPLQKEFPASVLEVVLSGCLNRHGKFPFYRSRDRHQAEELMKNMDILDLKNKSFSALSGGDVYKRQKSPQSVWFARYLLQS